MNKQSKEPIVASEDQIAFTLLVGHIAGDEEPLTPTVLSDMIGIVWDALRELDQYREIIGEMADQESK